MINQANIKTGILLTFLTFLSGGIFAQKSFILEGQIVNASKLSLTLNNFVNGKPNAITTQNLDEEGRFKIEGEVDATDYYQVVLSNQQSTYIVVQPGDHIKLYGDANDLFNICNMVDSRNSSVMQTYLREFNDYKALEDSLNKVLQQDPSKLEELNKFYTEKAGKFFQYRNILIKEYPNSPGILFVLNSIDPNKEGPLYEQVLKSMIDAYAGSPTGDALSQQYEQLKGQKEKDSALSPGTEAKDIALPNPEGEIMKLSDLKGKVVLLDFWASWCGPCRKENPSVVAAYDKYKDKGFTVFSVSLDKDRNRWLQAIEQDRLSWPNHVSDLKGWGSAGAQTYGVSGIPFTVLIDKEGKIIATNLRGHDLENKLASIFSE